MKAQKNNIFIIQAEQVSDNDIYISVNGRQCGEFTNFSDQHKILYVYRSENLPVEVIEKLEVQFDCEETIFV